MPMNGPGLAVFRLGLAVAAGGRRRACWTVRCGPTSGAWQGGGRGQPYRSEVLAFQAGQTVRLINAVYWSRVGIGAVGRTQAAPSVAVASGVPQAADGCPTS